MPLLLSVVNCLSPSLFANWLSLGSFANSSSGFSRTSLPPLPVSSEILSPSPLFVFALKQTKGSSAWWTTHIVSQNIYEVTAHILLYLIDVKNNFDSIIFLFLISISSDRNLPDSTYFRQRGITWLKNQNKEKVLDKTNVFFWLGGEQICEYNQLLYKCS